MVEKKLDQNKLDIQELEYTIPVHWRLGYVDDNRYKSLSLVLAKTICNLSFVATAQKVSILDLGCGDGAGTWQLLKILKENTIKVRVYGSDYSAVAINWAKKMTSKYCDDDLVFKVAGAEEDGKMPDMDYPLVVVMREVIEHLTEDQFGEIIKNLRSTYQSGYLIITTPTINSPTESKHYRHYDEKLIRDWFSINRLRTEMIFGFAFRPRSLYGILSRLKSILNNRVVFWRLMSPFWRSVPLCMAQTVVGVASWSIGED